MVADAQYDEAVQVHEKSKKKLYNNKSIILYQLNSGMLNHYAGNEDIYISAFNALSYYKNNKQESAAVEARRMIDKLKFAGIKNDAIAGRLEEKDRADRKTKRALRDAKELGVALTFRRFGYRTVLNDSVLGRCLGMLFYRRFVPLFCFPITMAQT